MAKKKSSFNVADGLFPAAKNDAHDVHDEQQVQQAQEVVIPEYGKTQGKKGHKLPRINMAFSPDNHTFIKKRSRQLGISATDFVNILIDAERKKTE